MARRERDAEANAYLSAALPRLGRLAGAITGNWVDGEDLLQDTATRVILKWQQVARSGNPDAYVRQMMLNLWASQRRRRASTELVSHDVATGILQGTTRDQEDCEDRDALLRRLAHLPRQQRAVLVLRYLEDLPDGAIAELLDCSTGAVSSAAHRGLAALRALEREEGRDAPEPPRQSSRAPRRLESERKGAT